MNAEHTSTKKRIWPRIGVIVLILAAFVIGRMTVRQAAPDHAHDEDQDAPAGRVEVWTCSMHPQVRQPEPGSCPICAMDLIPVEDDEDEFEDDEDVVRLRVSPRAAALMEIQTWPAERRSVEVELRSFGRIDFNEARLVDVVARSAGYIERLHANFNLQRVEKGDVLAEIFSPDVTMAMRELLVAQPRGGETLASARARLVRMGVSSEQIDEVLETGEVPRTYRIYSSVDGVVKIIGEREGQWLREGGRIVQLADLSTVWVQLEAFETELPWVAAGRPVHFTAQAYPGEEFEGEVVYVEPVLNPRTRTVRFRAEVPNPDGRLKPGLFVRGTLHAPTATLAAEDADEHAEHAGHAGHAGHEMQDETPIVVPASAPLITGRRALVYIRVPDAEQPTFEPRHVVLGPRAGAYYVVRDGLEEGDLVVVHGQFKIDSELQIRGRPSMMAPEGEAPPDHHHGPEEHADTEEPRVVVDPEEVPADFSRQIGAVLESYLKLSDAMADDDFDASMANLRAMHNRLLEVDGDLLAGEARSVWEEIEASLHPPQHEMIEKDDLEGLRKPFEPLTRAMIRAVEGFGGEVVGQMNVMHCPMAFDFEGADWLQKDDAVRNPYFGAVMFRCGEVRRSLGSE